MAGTKFQRPGMKTAEFETDEELATQGTLLELGKPIAKADIFGTALPVAEYLKLRESPVLHSIVNM